MRRLITILLLLIVPLQLTYAAAAVYCQHESGGNVAHFGHHSHEHRAQGGTDQNDGKNKPSLQLDQDCGFCHLQMPQVLSQQAAPDLEPIATPLERTSTIRFASVDRRRIERPNWSAQR